MWSFPVLYNPWLIHEDIITLTAMMAAVGCLGIVLGFSLSFREQKYSEITSFHKPEIRDNKLNITMSGILLFSGLFLSFLAAPAELITQSAYTTSEPILINRGFDSAWMVSYVLFSFAYCDAWLDRGTSQGKIKRIMVLIITIFSIVYFQVLRGDREAFGWVIGLLILPYFFSGAFNDLKPIRLSIVRVLLAIFAVLLINFAIGFSRYRITDISLLDFVGMIIDDISAGHIGFTTIFTGTWSAVLLGPLGVAGSYIHGYFELKGGNDYVDLLLSLPPGFVANALDYVRPINGTNSPAWEMTVGMGGWHAIILPFRNFLMAGVFFIPAIYAFLIMRCEGLIMKNISVKYAALFLVLIMSFPHWLWYGEKSMINAIIIWYLALWLYRIFYSFQILYRAKLI